MRPLRGNRTVGRKISGQNKRQRMQRMQRVQRVPRDCPTVQRHCGSLRLHDLLVRLEHRRNFHRTRALMRRNLNTSACKPSCGLNWQPWQVLAGIAPQPRPKGGYSFGYGTQAASTDGTSARAAQTVTSCTRSTCTTSSSSMIGAAVPLVLPESLCFTSCRPSHDSRNAQNRIRKQQSEPTFR